LSFALTTDAERIATVDNGMSKPEATTHYEILAPEIINRYGVFATFGSTKNAR
jgi:hypothetical protein